MKKELLIVIGLLGAAPISTYALSEDFVIVSTDGVRASGITPVTGYSKGLVTSPPHTYPISTVFPQVEYEYWKLDASTNWVAMTQAEQDVVDQALLDESVDSSTWTAREEGLLRLVAEVGNITPREAKTKLKRHMNPTRIKKERKARRGN
jgi:hypothetical protein